MSEKNLSNIKWTDGAKNYLHTNTNRNYYTDLIMATVSQASLFVDADIDSASILADPNKNKIRIWHEKFVDKWSKVNLPRAIKAIIQ